MSQEHCHKNDEAFKKKSYTKSQTYSNIRDMPIFETTMQNTRSKKTIFKIKKKEEMMTLEELL